MAGVTDIIGLGILLKWKDQATAQMKKAEQALGSLGEEADETEKKTARLQASFAKLAKVGAGITAFGVGGAAAIYGLASAASTFEDALIDTMTMTGLTGKAFDDMQRSLGALSTEMSARFAMSAADINKAFYQVLSSGAQAGTKQFQALTDSALMLARVVGMEPAVAVESLSDALHSFEMDVTQAEKMSDVFFKASMMGATTVPQLTEAMNEAAKVAVEMKLPLEDVASVLVGFANKGVKGARAGTAFRMVMTKLAAPSDEAAEALARLGVAVFDADTKAMRPIVDILRDMQTGLAGVTHEEREAILKAVSGEEVFAKLGGLLSSDLSVLEGWSAELKRGGVMQTAFQQKAETLSFAFAGARESLRNVAIALGRHLLPILKPVGNAIAWLAEKTRAFVEAHPLVTKIAVGLLAVATAAALIVGPVITVVGIIGALGGIPAIIGAVSAGFASLGAATGALGAVLSAAFWPVTLIAAGVAALYFAFKYNFLGIRTAVVAVGKVLWEYLLGAWEGVKAALSPLIDTFRETWAVLKEAFAPIWEVVAGIGDLIGLSVEGSSGLDTFKNAAKAVGKVVGFAVVLPLRLALTAVSYLVQGFAWLFKGAVSLGGWLYGKLEPYLGAVAVALQYLLTPIGLVVEGFRWIVEKVGTAVSWIIDNWSLVEAALLSPVRYVREGWARLTDSIGAAIGGVCSSIKAAVAGAVQWISGVWPRVRDVLLAPVNYVSYGWSRLTTALGATFAGISDSVRGMIGGAVDWISAKWAAVKDVMLAPIDAIRAGWTSLTEGLTGAFTTVYDTVAGVFNSLKDTIMGSIEWVWSKVTWVISKIPDAFLPESLEQIKYGRLTEERGVAMGGHLVVPATAPAVQRASPRPTLPREIPAMPAMALAGAAAGGGGGTITIEPGAIVINATRIDERAAMLIDRELAKLLERRLERQ